MASAVAIGSIMEFETADFLIIEVAKAIMAAINCFIMAFIKIIAASIIAKVALEGFIIVAGLRG